MFMNRVDATNTILCASEEIHLILYSLPNPYDGTSPIETSSTIISSSTCSHLPLLAQLISPDAEVVLLMLLAFSFEFCCCLIIASIFASATLVGTVCLIGAHRLAYEDANTSGWIVGRSISMRAHS